MRELLARLGNVLYWIGTAIAVFFLAIGVYVVQDSCRPRPAPGWRGDPLAWCSDPGAFVPPLVFFGGLAVLSWLAGLACRYILRGPNAPRGARPRRTMAKWRYTRNGAIIGIVYVLADLLFEWRGPIYDPWITPAMIAGNVALIIVNIGFFALVGLGLGAWRDYRGD
jgi:hypothetical protein